MNRSLLILKTILFTTVIGFFYSSCKIPKATSTSKEAYLGFYNLENLFDTLKDARVNDDDFLPSGKYQWNTERYQTKLKNLALVIDSFYASPTVFLGVCEIENESVLLDLTNKLNGNWKVYTSPSPDARGIDVGILCKGKMVFQELIDRRIVFPDDPTSQTRNIHISRFELEGKTILMGICHFPSRRGGEEASEPRRVYVAQRMNFYLDSMRNAYPEAQTVVMGDFNDEPIDSSLKVLASFSNGKTLFNLMKELKEKGEGSYRYRNEWNMLDQILVSDEMLSGAKGFKVNKAEIYKQDWLFEQEGKYAGNPLRTFGGLKYLSGYSDHLPVRVKLMY